GPEICDGAPPAGECSDYGYDYGRIGCAACAVSFEACKTIGWRLEDSTTSEAINDLAVAPDGTEYAAAASLLLQRRPGQGWSSVTIPGLPPLISVNAVAAFANDDVYAVGTATSF